MPQIRLPTFVISAVSLACLTACGGGGGTDDATNAATIAVAQGSSPSPSASPNPGPSATASASPTPSATPATGSGGGQQGPASSSCGLKAVFMDEFNDLSVSPRTIGATRWTAHTPWNGDFGDARFLDPGPDGPFAVKDGILTITVKKDSNGKWTGGLLAAADSSGAGYGARYGYFEARMKMPPGSGVWPAFWLHSLKPTAGGPNGDVELDGVEFYGVSNTSYYATSHVWYREQHKEAAHRIEVQANSLTDQYHTYGIDIAPQTVSYLFDGKVVATDPTPPELKEPMHPLINMAIGGGWPIDGVPNPSILYVDYVRVYQREGAPPAGCQPGGPK